jgi:twitching motility protein PilI
MSAREDVVETPTMRAANEPARPGRWLTPSAALNRYPALPEERGPVFVQRPERVRHGFRVGSLALLIGTDTPREVIASPAISTLPNGPAWLAGMMNVRGNLVPVFDLALALNVSRQDAAREFALVLEKGERAVAMLIDGLPIALSGMQPLERLPHLPPALQDHVQAAFVKDEITWLAFDHENFFAVLASQSAG